MAPNVTKTRLRDPTSMSWLLSYASVVMTIDSKSDLVSSRVIQHGGVLRNHIVQAYLFISKETWLKQAWAFV